MEMEIYFMFDIVIIFKKYRVIKIIRYRIYVKENYKIVVERYKVRVEMENILYFGIEGF